MTCPQANLSAEVFPGSVRDPVSLLAANVSDGHGPTPPGLALSAALLLLRRVRLPFWQATGRSAATMGVRIARAAEDGTEVTPELQHSARILDTREYEPATPLGQHATPVHSRPSAL